MIKIEYFNKVLQHFQELGYVINNLGITFQSKKDSPNFLTPSFSAF